MSQERLNALHHHFEVLMGQSWNRAELAKYLPPHIMAAVRRLNELVHDFAVEDLSTFTFETSIGDLVSSYCQLGKTWVEVYQDRDDHISANNISPLRFYASMMTYMDYETPKESSDSLRAEVKTFIKNYALKNGLNLDPDDPAHAIGHSVLASLPKDSPLLLCSDLERAEFFRVHSNITSIRVVSNGEEFRRDFPVCDNYFTGPEFVIEGPEIS